MLRCKQRENGEICEGINKGKTRLSQVNNDSQRARSRLEGAAIAV